MVLTLYKIDASPPVRSVFMTIEALGLTDVEYVDVNLLEGAHLKEEFVKMNPQHTVPLLKDDDFLIWDSHAIATYLVSKFGKDDSLYPADLKKRAIIDQRLHFDSGILFPALRGTVEPVFFGSDTSFKPENLARIQKAYDFTEKFLDKEWLADDKLTLADICCFSSLSTMNEIQPIDGNSFPKLAAWMEKCGQQDIMKKGNEPGLVLFQGLVKSKLG